MAASQDKINVGALATVGAVGLISTLATVYAVYALYFYGLEKELKIKVIDVPYTQVVRAKLDAAAHLSSVGWVNKEAGQVHIPIEQAKQAVLRELR